MNTDAGLTLPEPAATLWRTTRETVRHGLDALGHGIEYRIGGGTILAARWGHRTSFDIDLNLDERIPLSRLHTPRTRMVPERSSKARRTNGPQQAAQPVQHSVRGAIGCA